MASVLEIAKKLNREFKDDKLAVKADITPDYERMPTGAFGFDYPLYGGLPLGRIATFAGLSFGTGINVFLSSMDSSLLSLTLNAAKTIDPKYSVGIFFSLFITSVLLYVVCKFKKINKLNGIIFIILYISYMLSKQIYIIKLCCSMKDYKKEIQEIYLEKN